VLQLSLRRSLRPMFFSYVQHLVPNAEWLRAQLSRATVLDRACAQVAIGETERCLRLRADGGDCRRFAAPVK
jgi:hypothetical protein